MVKIGVVIGRFQVPELTLGHEYVLETAFNLTDKLIIFIGRSEAQTKRNPLTFEIRARMIEDRFKFSLPERVVILPLDDHPDDKEWVKQITDVLIRTQDAWGRQLYVFGGRDSCLETYRKNGGQGACIHLDSPTSVSGTEVRNNIKAWYSEDFRAGMIYHSQNQFPRAYPVVDVIIWKQGIGKPSSTLYLMARKANDEAGKWRFVGGFVDPTDKSYEMAVRREVQEETGLEVDNFQYVGSTQIDDWRYKKCEEKVISGIYTAQYIFGAPKAKDDISDVRWFTLDEVKRVIHPVHKPVLYQYLIWINR